MEDVDWIVGAVSITLTGEGAAVTDAVSVGHVDLTYVVDARRLDAGESARGDLAMAVAWAWASM